MHLGLLSLLLFVLCACGDIDRRSEPVDPDFASGFQNQSLQKKSD